MNVNFELLGTISTICFLFSGGFLVVTVLLFFLLDIRKDMDYLSGRAAARAIEEMREEGADRAAQAKPNDLSKMLRKRSGAASSGELRESRRLSGRITPPQRQTQAPAPQPAPPAPARDTRQRPAPRPAQADYFGTGYVAPAPQSVPRPAPAAPAPEKQTVVLQEEKPTELLEEQGTQLLGAEQTQLPEERGTQLLGEERQTVVLTAGNAGLTAQLQEDGTVVLPTPAEEMAAMEAEIVPVEMTILDDILLIHSDDMIEI